MTDQDTTQEQQASPPQEEKKPAPLPHLRDDLSLHPGPREKDGSPSWTLHDHARNRFFRIGWAEFEMLCRWHLEKADDVIEHVNNETTLHIDEDHVTQLTQFLVFNALVRAQGKESVERFKKLKKSAEKSHFQWLLHNYLFFKIPLFKPDRFLERTLPHVQIFYSQRFFIFLAALGFVGIFLIARQWDKFTQTFLYFFNVEGILYYGIALIMAKIVHELGHAYTTKRFGLRVPTMGVAFLVMWPVLYTDTTEAWKLPSRYQRVMIGAAGMAAELMLALVATFLWSFTPPGPFNSALFLLATVTWIMTIFVNTNPCMRFDGYYLLSDFLDVQNLQERSFALGKWRLRKTLFGFDDPVPEAFPRKLHIILTVYAYATWIYRFLLFISIALLVYHFFFKLLGIFLMVVEVLWFIILPIWREIKFWWTRRGDMTLNKNTKIFLGCLAGVFLVLIVPWKSSITAPAVLRYEQFQRVFPAVPAQVKKIHVKNGDYVQQGDTLFHMISPEIENEIKKKKLEINSLRWQLSRQASDEDTLEQRSVIAEELATALSELMGFEKQRQKLHITAPISGMVTDLDGQLRIDQWYSDSMPLALVLNENKLIVEAYISEKDLLRLKQNEGGYFKSENMIFSDLSVKINKVSETNTIALDTPYLASVYGGDIAVNEDKKDEQLVPTQSIYRILLEPEDLPEGNYGHIWRGEVVLAGEAESLFYKMWRVVASVFIRESGF